MGAPTIGDPASMVGPYYDGEAVAAASAWTPTLSGKTFTRGFLCTTAGNLVVDFVGVQGAQPGATSVTIAMLAGVVYPIAIKAAHNTGTAAGIALY